MSYKYSKGAQVIGDLKAADDTERNTLIDFGEDYIGFETSGSLRMKISGSDGAITFNEAFTFPISDGSANQVLKTDGAGQLSWSNQSGGSGGGTGLEYATGHVDLTVNNKPVNWVNASSISAASGIKSWFIVPKDTTIDKVIVSVKGNNFNTANDGNVTLSIFKNQADYGSTIVNQTVGADDFTEKVSNMAGGTTDCNQKTFSGLNQSVSEGDLIHIKVGKSAGSDKEALVTIVFDSGGGGGAISSVSNGADDRIATFSSSNALNGESNLNFDGTVLSQNGAPGNAGAYTRLVVKKTGLSDNVETAIVNFTIPNDLHAAGVFVKGIVTNNNCTRSGAFTHSFSIVRTINNTATAGFPSNTGVLATEATSGGGSPDFTIAGDHNASGGATESNTISYTLTVNTNPSQTSNCVLVVEMINYNSSGITMSIA